MSWFFFLVFAVLFSIMIFRWSFIRKSSIGPKWLFVAFAIKVLCGIFYIWLYSSYYSNRANADVYKYFDDGKILYKVSEVSIKDYLSLTIGLSSETQELSKKYLLDTRFWDRSPSLSFFNDNRMIIRFHALIYPLSQGNIYLHLLFANFISFLGLFMLFLFFRSIVKNNEIFLFAGIMLLPSLLFWSSSILKENFLLLGLGGLLYHIKSFYDGNKKSILFMIAFALLIAFSKIYVLIALIPSIIAHHWVERNNTLAFWKYLWINVFFIALALNLGDYYPQLSIKNALAFKQSEFKCLAEWTGAGSRIDIPDLDNTTWSFIRSSPNALINSLFRPFPWDKGNILSLMAMLELTALYLLFFISLKFRNTKSVMSKNFILFGLNFILLIALLIGWTTPVTGAIVRYRIVILPFFIAFIAAFLDLKKLSKFVTSKISS